MLPKFAWFSFVLLAAVALTPPSPAAQPTVRTWTDATGKFRVRAEFLGIKEGRVQLKKSDGTTLECRSNG